MRRRAAPFVGRRAELAEVDALWVEAASGCSAGVLISGEAGVGKTRLVAECVHRAQANGAQVLAGTCVRLSSGGLPYGPILDALRRFLRERGLRSLEDLLGAEYGELDRLLRADPHEVQSAGSSGTLTLRQARLFELLLGLLIRLAQDGPVVVVAEDIHWAEPSTLDVLSFLATALSNEPVLLVITFRSDEPSVGSMPSALLELMRSPRMTHLALAPFDLPELTELVTALAPEPLPDPEVRAIAERSGGNAFFAEELVAARGISGGTGLPGQVRDVVLLRIATMSSNAQHVVRLAAVVGRRVEHSVLARVSGLTEPALLDALRELVVKHLLVADADRTYRFRHALAQEAVYSDLLPGERAKLHGLVATALTDDLYQTPGPRSTASAVVAHHWQMAGNTAKALMAAVVAGRDAAEVHAYSEAFEYLNRAVMLWDEVPDAPSAVGLDRPDLLTAAARMAFYAGHEKVAIRLVEQALARLPADDLVRRALGEEEHGWYLSRLDGGRSLAAFQEAHRLLVGSGATLERTRVTAALAQALSNRGQYGDSAPYWEETLALARATGCRREEVLGLRTSGWHVAMHGDPDAGIERLREAVRVAAAESDVEGMCVSYNHLCLALDFVGRSAECLATAQEALRWSSDSGVLFTPMVDMLDSIVLVLFRLGRWSQAESVADRILGGHLGMKRALMTAVVLAEIASARGEPGEAQRQLELAQTMLEGDEDPLNHGLMHAAAATSAIWLGQHQAAREHVEVGLQIVGRRGDDQQAIALCTLGVRVEADEAERCRARGSSPPPDVVSRGQELVGRADQTWDGMGSRRASFPEAAVERVAAHAEFERLTGTSGQRTWVPAAEGWEALDRPYAAAYARWRQAEVLVRLRDADAAPVLRRARAHLGGLDASALAEEVTALARLARLDLEAPPPPEVPPEVRPFHLTDREVQVLQLVEQGRTNREIGRALFISESTASVHVSRILAKLGARNRVEAASIAHRLGLAKPGAEPG